MASSPVVAVYGLGFPPERLSHLAATAGLPVWRPDLLDVVPRGRVVVLLGHAWEGLAPSYWAAPYTAWIEVGALADNAILELIGQATEADLYASFTTVTANRLNLAGEFLAALMGQRALDNETRESIELALHEALCNALLHGNLQLDSIGALSVDALEQFSANLTRRITDPDFANRRIDVLCAFGDDAIVIDVADEGVGFVMAPRGESKASGRGLALIEASCQSYQLLDGGRRVSMRFPA